MAMNDAVRGVAGPLEGIVVADFSRVLAGPYATMMLGDLGATVIKVERPGVGDETRMWGPPYLGETSTYYLAVNRNKRSIELDLGSPDGVRTAEALIDRADVLIENFLPGQLSRFGLDPEMLLGRHPELVHCSITGFGDTQDLPGYDFVVQAAAGLMSVTGDPDGEPRKVGVALGDVLAGLHAALAILAALHDRERTGRGQHIGVSLFSALLSSMVNQASAYLNGGQVPGRLGNRHPSVVPYETLAAADGPIAIAVGNDRQFEQLCRVLGRPGLADDSRFSGNPLRVAHREELVLELQGCLAGRTARHWVSVLNSAGVPAATVNDLSGAFELGRELGLEPVVRFEPEGGDRVATVRNPIELSSTPATYRRPPPSLGADTEEVLAWLAGKTELSS